MIEVEVFGADLAPRTPTREQIERLCARVAASMGVDAAHVAVEFVDARRIAQLNAEHRDRPAATDVLSFPIDGAPALGDDAAAVAAVAAGVARPTRADPVPRELGDIVICPEHTADVREAIVHGMLHLLGMDHETDDGEMLARQRRLLGGADV
jgi:probable rRNA maturation factor